MKTLNAKNTSESFANASIPSFLTLAVDEKQLLINTNTSLIKLAIGGDLRETPAIVSLFPRKDWLDYNNIANEAVRILKLEFVENEVFTQKEKLGTIVAHLKRLAMTNMLQEKDVLSAMAALENILGRTSQNDIQLASVGYYASAAQIHLNCLALLAAMNPEEASLKTKISKRVVEHCDYIRKIAETIRLTDREEQAKKVGACIQDKRHYPNMVVGFTDSISGNTIHCQGSNAMAECSFEREVLIQSRMHAADFLDALVDQWKVVRVAANAGERSLLSFSARNTHSVELPVMELN